MSVPEGTEGSEEESCSHNLSLPKMLKTQTDEPLSCGHMLCHPGSGLTFQHGWEEEARIIVEQLYSQEPPSQRPEPSGNMLDVNDDGLGKSKPAQLSVKSFKNNSIDV